MKKLPLFLLFSALAASAPADAEIYVDSLGNGDGTSPASALPTIREALDVAGPGCTIWVRGGEGRAYGVTNETDTLQIPASMAGLSIRAYETTPGDGGRASVAISDTYINDGHRAHVISNAASFVTVSGLAFSFGINSLGKQKVGSCSLFRNDGAFATLENCVFRMAKPTGFGGSGSTAASPLVWCKTTDATNLVVRGCEFYNTRCWSVGHGYAPIQCMSNAQIVGNVFSNVNSIVVPEQKDWRSTQNVFSGNILIASNIVYGVNEHNISDNYPGVLRGVYPGPSSAEIAYNRFVFDRNARAEKGNALQHRVWMSLGGQFGSALSGGDATLIHHNTIIGGTAAFLLKEAQGVKRKTKFFSNLILLDPGSTNLVENVSSGTTAFAGGRTTSFIEPSCLRNNAYTGVLTGGTATQVSNYDIGAGLYIADNVQLAVRPDFLCTNDIYSADFYRYRSGRAAGDLGRLGWPGPDGTQPRYVGAVPPKYPDQTLMVLR